MRGGEDWRLRLGGYVQSLTAAQDLGYDLPIAERRSVFHGDVVRLRWSAQGEGWFFELHNRVQGTVSSVEMAAGQSVVGFGVSAVPERTVGLETTLIEDDRLRVWHDLDRLALTIYTDAADVTVGRQGITWGLSLLFPIADLWSRFSPFELDTEEKPGIDAVRLLTYPGDVEVDAVVADRGSLDDLSAGIRVSLSLAAVDLYVAAGKFWREAIVMAGATYLFDEVKVRAEAAFPFEPDGGGAAPPRATLGLDWLRGDWLVSGELHYNGIGARYASEYVDVLADPRFVRGETYFLGERLLGVLVSHSATDRLALSLSMLANLEDPSTALTPAITYDFGQSARFSIGGLISWGERPDFPEQARPRLRSEFGTYGRFGWTQLSVYF